MMGTKARLFTLLPPVTLEELVPADHVYRHLASVLDLSFVRDLVQDCYAAGGSPSVDLIVSWAETRVPLPRRATTLAISSALRRSRALWMRARTSLSGT